MLFLTDMNWNAMHYEIIVLLLLEMIEDMIKFSELNQSIEMSRTKMLEYYNTTWKREKRKHYPQQISRIMKYKSYKNTVLHPYIFNTRWSFFFPILLIFEWTSNYS